MDNSEIVMNLRKYVISNFLLGAGDSDFKNDDSFLEKGIVDSTGILELVSFIEENYKFKVKDDELTPDNLDTIDKLAAFIGRKLIK